MSDEAVTVVQQANLRGLIQQALEGFDESTTPLRASRHIANLHANLRSLREIDGRDFDRDWKKIRHGRLIEAINRGANVTWHDVRRAKEALIALMDRHGMGFQQELMDPLEEEWNRLNAELDDLIRDLEDGIDPEPDDLEPDWGAQTLDYTDDEEEE